MWDMNYFENSIEGQQLDSWLGIFPSPLPTGSPLSTLRPVPGSTTHRPCPWALGPLGFPLGSANGELTGDGPSESCGESESLPQDCLGLPVCLTQGLFPQGRLLYITSTPFLSTEPRVRVVVLLLALAYCVTPGVPSPATTPPSSL